VGAAPGDYLYSAADPTTMSPLHCEEQSVVIIGAGPAGLTAAYLLSKSDLPVTVVEADPEYVGGISRTVNYKGFHFDIGGHRFFSKSREVEDLWTEILSADLLLRPRSSRVFYGGKFYTYPLKAGEALVQLGPVECMLCVLSYLKSRILPIRDVKSFEDWVTNQFGARLFRIFFKTYTEKVWGMSCQDISADWAAQRIKGMSLAAAIRNALLPQRNGQAVIKTMIESFRYPRLGPGMMWEACAQAVRHMGGKLLMGHRVAACAMNSESSMWTVTCEGPNGERREIKARHIVSSAPLPELARVLEPLPKAEVLAAANALHFRDFLTVVLISRDRDQFSDNWIYIHDPSVKVGRIQNYKSWSPEMVPDPAYCCYGLEYFCLEGDERWNSTDEQLMALARQELEKIGLGKAEDVLDGCVVRQRKAYPVYDDGYAANVAVIREALEREFPSLHLVGRNGMHKYNNQDHAMMTAMLTVKNILAGARMYDVWCVNQDAEYHEDGPAADHACKTSPRWGRRKRPKVAKQPACVSAESRAHQGGVT
jgi:protoporphyrinogen oxidase